MAFVWLYGVAAVVLWAPAALVDGFVEGGVTWSGVAFMAGSALLHIGYFVALQKAYAVGNLSVVYPLARGTGPVLSVAAAIVFLGERPSALGLAGGALIVAAILALAVGSRAGVGLAIATGAWTAAYTVWDAHAVTTLHQPPIFYAWAYGAMLALVLTPFASGAREQWRDHRRAVIGIGALSPLAYILMLFALTRAPISLVAPVRESSVVVGALLGASVLKEGQLARRVIAATAIAIGHRGTGVVMIVERAVAAAVAVASEQGLQVKDPVVVAAGSNVIVHLRPNPIVARVMTGTVVLHPDPRAWLTREIDVGAFLRERIAVVAPTNHIHPGPYVHGDLWLSFWEHVEVQKTPREANVIGRALRELHDALAEYRGPLPPRAAVIDEIDWLLNALPGEAGFSAERDRVAALIRELEHAADRQPIHGDASFSNLLATGGGPRWNDFEDVCVGRVEWDVAGVLADAKAAHGEVFSAAVLAAYGGGCDPAAIERIDEVHALYGDLWRSYRAVLASC